MKLDRNELSKAVRVALSMGAVAAVGVVGTAQAQDQTAAQGTNQQPQTLQTIVVTGSHIRRVDLETSNPVITVSAQQIQQSGKQTLGDIVQQLPAITGGQYNPTINNGGGTGGSYVNLRGLGSARSLVLIDGHRINNNDLNSIPVNMIERVEVLTDGASSVYGSDAIAGVVNFITRKNYQGAEFSVDYGVSDHNDGARKGYSFTFGQTTDKGSIIAGVNYNKQDGILGSNRSFSRNAVDITGSPSTPIYTYIGGSSFPPYGNFQLPDSLAAQYNYCGKTPSAKNPNPSTRVGLNAGATGLNPSTDYHCWGTVQGDKYNYAAVNWLLTPTERTSAFIEGEYKLSDNVSAYMSLYHNKTTSSAQLAPALFGVAYGAVISKDAYYNPFGEGFDPADLDYRLRLVSAGPRGNSYGTVSDQFNSGLKGNFNLGPQSWNWDFGFGYGHTSLTNITTGLPNVTQLNKDLGPSMLINGVPTCVNNINGGTGTDNIVTSCTPFNPFNQFDPNSAAILAASAEAAINHSYSSEKYASLDFSGGLFDLPAGTAQLAVGADYRKEYTHSFVDPVLLLNPDTGNCTLGSQCSAPLQGGYNVKEAYAELFIPILKDLPFAYALNVTIGDRYSKYSTFGSTNNTKFAVEWRPIEDLLLRGTVSKVFRAPTVGDVFLSPVSSAPSLGSDPCDGITVANPACVGVPLDGSFVNTDVASGQQIKGIVSGAKYAGFPIGPEQGKSFDWGAVYSPHFIPGLSLSADYWRVYLTNTITGIGAQSVLDLCFNGATQYCPLISRNQTSGPNAGQITQILMPTVNLGRTDARGVDFTANYRLPQFSFGQFDLGVQGTYLAQYDVATAPGEAGNSTYHFAGHSTPFDSAAQGACPGSSGVCTFPRLRAQGFLNWQLGPWSASWRMRYIGKFRMGSADLSQGSSFIAGWPGQYRDFGATVYNDLSAGYNIEPINTRIDLGIDNVTNKQPPMMYSDTNTLNDATDPGNFDVIGRYYWGRVTVKF